MIDKSFIFVLKTKLKTYLIISVIFPIKVQQTIDKVVKITHYYAEFYILHQYCAQRHCKSTKMHVYTILNRIYRITFAWIIHLRSGVEIRSGVGPILSVVSVVASGISRGLVVQSGDWSAGRTGVGREERDLSVGASGIQRGYSGSLSGIDTLFNQSG